MEGYIEMPTVIRDAKNAGLNVVMFDLSDYLWLDLGRVPDIIKLFSVF